MTALDNWPIGWLRIDGASLREIAPDELKGLSDENLKHLRTELADISVAIRGAILHRTRQSIEERINQSIEALDAEIASVAGGIVASLAVAGTPIPAERLAHLSALIQARESKALTKALAEAVGRFGGFSDEQVERKRLVKRNLERVEAEQERRGNVKRAARLRQEADTIDARLKAAR